MYGASKMPAVVDKWICSAASEYCDQQQQIWKHSKHTVFSFDQAVKRPDISNQW
jgi:hypothetical protein